MDCQLAQTCRNEVENNNIIVKGLNPGVISKVG